MLPNVSRANIDESKLKAPKLKMVDESVVTLPVCNESFLPDDQWEREILDAFSELRVFIHRQSQLEATKARKVPVPPMKDEAAWRVFCFGKNFTVKDLSSSNAAQGTHFLPGGQMSEGEGDGDLEDVKRRKIELTRMLGLNPDGAEDKKDTDDKDACDVEVDDDDNSEDADAEPVDHAAKVPSALPVYKEWEGPADVAPTVALLLQFDQVMTQRLLAHHVHWLVDGG